MLILAGVTISIVAGSDGLIAKAEKAVTETEKAAMQEDAELAIATIKMDYYEDYAANKNMTAKEFIVANLAKPYKTARGATMEVDAEGNITYTLDGVTTQLTIDENGKVTIGETSGDSGSSSTPVIPEGLEVGDTVTYSPSGTYTWEAEYASSDLAVDGTADVTLASGTSVTSSNQDMSIKSWKVFSIDESTGKVELVPSEATTNQVRLQGAQGYNNAVKLLNDACSNLYANGSTITARSINIEDIEGRMTEEALESAYTSSSDNVQYGAQYTSEFKKYRYYPVMYGKEIKSVIDGVENTTGLGVSEQTGLIERTDEGATSGRLQASTSIQPYSAYWSRGNEFMQTAFKGAGTGTSNTNYNLIFSSSSSLPFAVASRVSAPSKRSSVTSDTSELAISLDPVVGEFYVYGVKEGLTCNILYVSDDLVASYFDGIRFVWIIPRGFSKL